MIFEKHIPLVCGTSPGLFTISTTSATYVETSVPAYAYLDPAQYSSGAFYYEVVLQTTAATAYARLYTAAGSAITGAELTTTSTSNVRLRSGDITSNISAGEHTDRIKNDGTNSTVFHGGRIVVIQNGTHIQKTETQVSIWKYNDGAIAGTSYQDPGVVGMSFFLYLEANWNGTLVIYHDATLKTSAGTGYATLATAAGTAVSSSEVTTTSTSYVRVRSAAVTLADATTYKVMIKNSGADTTNIRDSRVVFQQTGYPTKTEAYLPVNLFDYAFSATGTPVDTSAKVYYDSANWSVNAIAWYAEYSYNSNVIGELDLWQVTGGAVVTSSAYATAAVIERARSSALTMPTTQEISIRGDSNSGTTYLAPCHLLAYITLTNSAPSASPSVSPSVSLSPSVSPSVSVSPSISVSPSVSPSVSISPSLSPSISPSVSPSVSVSPSLSPSASPSLSPSVSPSASVSPSLSPSLSPSVSPSPSPSPSPAQGSPTLPTFVIVPSLPKFNIELDKVKVKSSRVY